MTIENHISEDDLVLFALQFLPEERMRAARQHVEQCEMCRGEIAKLQGDLVAYAMTADIQAPPASARERLLKQVAKEPRPAPIQAAAAEPKPRPEPLPRGEPTFTARQSRILPMETQEERRPRRAPWMLAWTGWAVAAGCSFLAGLQFHQRQQLQSTLAEQQARIEQTTRDAAKAQDALATLTASNARQVALHLTPASGTKTAVTTATPAAAPAAMAAYLADKGALIFVATHMQPVATGKAYELWLLPADDSDPIPAGTFKPDASGNGSIVLPQIPKGVAAKGFGITIENEGGSPVPTTPVMMAGT